MEAFALKILHLALYARGDSNPQPLAPEAKTIPVPKYLFVQTLIASSLLEQYISHANHLLNRVVLIIK